MDHYNGLIYAGTQLLHECSDLKPEDITSKILPWPEAVKLVQNKKKLIILKRKEKASQCKKKKNE